MDARLWIGGAAAVALAFAVNTGAQTTSSTTTTRTNADRGAVITVSGCLQRGEATSPSGAVGTSGTVDRGNKTQGAGTLGDQFVLVNATPGTPGGAPSTSLPPRSSDRASQETAGTSGSNGAAYLLEGKRDELMKNVAHQVEITGRLIPSAASSSSMSNQPGTTQNTPDAAAAARGATSDQQATSSGTNSGPTVGMGESTVSGNTAGPNSVKAQRLRVESVRMIAASCTTSK